MLHVDNGGTGLTSVGTSNQVLGANAAGNAYEHKSIVGTTGRIVVTNTAGQIQIDTGANVGTVQSVALTAPSIFTVSGSPVTTTGTLDFALNTQAKNLVFAGPATGSDAAPTFRALAYADLPIVNYTEVASTSSTITAPTTSVTASTSFTVTSPDVEIVSNKAVFGAASDAKTAVLTSKVSTTDASVTALSVGTQAANSLWTYTITIAALGSSDQAAYKLEGGIMYNGTTSTVIGGSKSVLAETTGAQAWDVNISASAGVVSVSVQGAASTTIKWVASAVVTEVA